ATRLLGLVDQACDASEVAMARDGRGIDQRLVRTSTTDACNGHELEVRRCGAGVLHALGAGVVANTHHRNEEAQAAQGESGADWTGKWRDRKNTLTENEGVQCPDEGAEKSEDDLLAEDALVGLTDNGEIGPGTDEDVSPLIVGADVASESGSDLNPAGIEPAGAGRGGWKLVGRGSVDSVQRRAQPRVTD